VHPEGPESVSRRSHGANAEFPPQILPRPSHASLPFKLIKIKLLAVDAPKLVFVITQSSFNHEISIYLPWSATVHESSDMNYHFLT
jgi:hypothetical protein